MPSFDNPKRLRFIITLGVGKFEAGGDRITIEGMRSIVDIDKVTGVSMSSLRAKIYGLSQSVMNSVTTYIYQNAATGASTYQPNIVEVYAIDGKAETLVFAGNMVTSWPDYSAMPDVFLQITAQAAYYNGLKPVPPRSFKGPIDVASVMAQIARDLGYTFENNGVTAQLSNVYLANSGLEQARELARMVPPNGLGFVIDDKTLAITPAPTLPRKATIPYIAKDTGMMGYPVYDGSGVTINVLFNPGITPLALIEVKSDNVRANGKWIVTMMTHRLESEKPGGAWFSTIRAHTSVYAIAK